MISKADSKNINSSTFTEEDAAISFTTKTSHEKVENEIFHSNNLYDEINAYFDLPISRSSCGRGNLVAKVTDSWLACQKFEPSTAEDRRAEGADVR
ncbi:hypothetical protein TNCV_2685261 [Trichonephila clavipes]|nr:hypothetical protein TNCV_2685261 [Trichonephila clavipes]